MSMHRCPGAARTLNRTPLEKKCLRCGETVEIWSDEEKVICKCGAPIFRNRDLTCVAWCPEAERCVGDQVDVEAIKAEARERAAKEGNPDFVKQLVALIRQKFAKCVHREGDDGTKK